MADDHSLYPPDFLASPTKCVRRRAGDRRTVTPPPPGVGPFVKLVFAEMARQRLTYDSVVEKSGVQRASIKAWRHKNRPGLESMTAVLTTLGYGLTATPALQVLPPDLAGDVTALALKLQKDVPDTWAALVDIGVEQRLLAMRAEERTALLASHDARRINRPVANDNVKPAAQVA